VEFEAWRRADKLFEGILGVDNRQLFRESRLKSIEDVRHQFTNQVEHLEVMVLELHLHIKSRELAQMAVSKGIFSAEHWSDLKNTL